MEKEFVGTDGEVGAISRWKGNKEVGEGEQEITKVVEGQRIESRLRFFKPWKSESDAFIAVAGSGDGSKVTWGFSGNNKFPFSIMTLFISMDKMMGKDFENGLQSLKENLEQ